MFPRSLFSSRPESISQTLVSAIVLLAVFNPTAWGPASESRPANDVGSHAQASPSRTTTVDQLPSAPNPAAFSSTNPYLRRADKRVGSSPSVISPASASGAITGAIL